MVGAVISHLYISLERYVKVACDFAIGEKKSADPHVCGFISSHHLCCQVISGNEQRCTFSDCGDQAKYFDGQALVATRPWVGSINFYSLYLTHIAACRKTKPTELRCSQCNIRDAIICLRASHVLYCCCVCRYPQASDDITSM